MAPDKADMLRHLDPVIRPGHLGVQRPDAVTSSPPADAAEITDDFDSLIDRAISGKWRAGEQSLERPPGVLLSHEESAQLQHAVERLAATGSRRAVVFVDQRAFMLDVRDRRIEAELTSASAQTQPEIIRDIDSAAITRTVDGCAPSVKPALIASDALRSMNHHVWSQGVSRVLSALTSAAESQESSQSAAPGALPTPSSGNRPSPPGAAPESAASSIATTPTPAPTTTSTNTTAAAA